MMAIPDRCRQTLIGMCVFLSETLTNFTDGYDKFDQSISHLHLGDPTQSVQQTQRASYFIVYFMNDVRPNKTLSRYFLAASP